MTNSPVQLIALTRAKALLAASGVLWATLNDDGTTDGPLQCRVLKARTPSLSPSGRRVSRGPNASLPNMQDKYDWHAKVDRMQPADSILIECESEADARQLNANIKSRVHRAWGPENYVLSNVGCNVEVLRVL